MCILSLPVRISKVPVLLCHPVCVASSAECDRVAFCRACNTHRSFRVIIITAALRGKPVPIRGVRASLEQSEIQWQQNAFPHAKTFLRKLCAILGLTLERLLGPALHRKSLNSIGFKGRHISLRGAPTRMAPALDVINRTRVGHVCVCLYATETKHLASSNVLMGLVATGFSCCRGTRVNDTCADKLSVCHTMFAGKWNVSSWIRRSKKHLFVILAML